VAFANALQKVSQPLKNDKPTILYFPGMEQTPTIAYRKIQKERGFGIFYLNNRGYGGSAGRPTEKDNIADPMRSRNI
jgi:uncharacterized protein